MNHIQTGFTLTGIFKGFRSTPWKNDPTKFNHRIGIATLKDDGYGGQSENLIEVDILQEDIPRIQQSQNDYLGKYVMINVVPMAKGKSWLSCFMPKGSEIKNLATVLKKAS